MSFWDNIRAQFGVRDEMPNQQLRNSIFGMDTATMPMPQYDDNLPRLQRRLYDMPELIGAGPPYVAPTSSYDPNDLFEGGVKPLDYGHQPDVTNSPSMPHRPEPGAFYFGGATGALSSANDGTRLMNDPMTPIEAPGVMNDPMTPIEVPGVMNNPMTPLWTPPTDSLVPFPSAEDRADAADIARNLGGTMFARPGAALDPNGRPVLINEDGSISTERNIGVSDPRLNKGRHTNIPSIQEGRQLSVNQAIDWALKSGIQYPSFDTPEAADAAAIARHRKLEPAGQGQPGQIVLPPIQNTPDFMNDELTAHLMQMLLGRQGQ